MSRYIDADALKPDYYDEYVVGDDEYVVRYYSETQIDNAPSIDIEPKRGEWIVYEGGWKRLDYYPPKCKCNQCGYEEELYIIHAKPTNFCPNCGCQMKVVDDEQ